MLEFQIFRVKVFPSKQGHLFREPTKPPEILKDVISSLRSAELRKAKIWHIGNVSPIGDSGLYFRIGRTAKYKLEFFKNGSFLDQEFEGAPYTHGVIDFELEVMAIAKKTILSPKTSGLANQFIRLLNESDRSRYYDAKFEIAEINDPTDFITHLHQSLHVTKFWVTFKRPNALDVNEDFIKPMEKLLSESEGEKGKTILEGDKLKPESLEDLARSAASAGNDAAAWLQMSETEHKIKKSLKGNPATLRCEDITEDEQKANLLLRIKDLYKKIRGAIN